MIPLIKALVLLFITLPNVFYLFEDQIGKVDWHVKYFGKVSHIQNDPNNLKRVLVSTEDSIGAVHGNTGAVLYRQLLEHDSKVLYFGIYNTQNTIVISKQDTIIKIRTFGLTTGILHKEWSVTYDTTLATYFDNMVYLFNSNEYNVISISGEELSESKEKFNGTNCKLISNPYVVCHDSSKISLYDVIEKNWITKQMTVNSIQANGEYGIINGQLYKLDKLEAVTQLTNRQFKDLSQYKENLYLTDGSKLYVYEITGSLTLKSTVDFDQKLKILHCYVLNNIHNIIGFTRNELLFSSTVGQGKIEIAWTREESLGNVLNIDLIDYPNEVRQKPVKHSSNVISAFINRIKQEIEALVVGDVLQEQDRFGFKKIIVYITSVGKIIGMENYGGILYSFDLKDFESYKGMYNQRSAKYIPLKPISTIVYKNSAGLTVLYSFNPLDGKVISQNEFKDVLQLQMVAGANEEFVKPLLLLNSQLNVVTYPSAVSNVDMKNYFFFVTDKKTCLINGYGIVGKNQLKAQLVWELNLSNNEEGNEIIGIYGKLAGEKIHSQGRVLPDRSVSYKYMNPNLAIIVTSNGLNINIYLIDVVSGAVIHSFWHKKCHGPVHIVHTEHWIIYTLFNEKNRRYELNSVELYEGQSQSNSTVFSSFSSPPVKPILVKQSFIFPTSIQYMTYTRTEKGITNKDLVIGLPTGGIIELPRIIVQPKLSQVAREIHQDEDGVVHSVPYIPELPLPSDMIINYNQSVKRIDGIKTWPTRLESTCIVMAYGSDIFYMPITPSKTFDILKDDFDYWFITVVLCGLCVGAYLTKRLTARKTLDAAWK